MKKLILSIFGLLLILLYSCSKDELVQPEQTGDLKSLSCDKDGLMKPSGVVFTVYPGGSDDTQAFIDAFDAAKAVGPGATVKLVEGEYHMSTIEIREFKGYFRGAGKGKTVVYNVPDLPCEEAFLANLCPALFRFVGGEFKISEMTFRIPDGRPCAYGPNYDQLMGDLYSVLVLADYTLSYTPEDRYIKAIVENVDFIGGYDDFYGVNGTDHNTGMVIWAGVDIGWKWDPNQGPFTNGDFVIRGCTIDHFLAVEAFGLGNDATIAFENNTVIRTGVPLAVVASQGSQVMIRNNQFIDGQWFNLWLDDMYNELLNHEVPAERNVYFISNNRFSSPEGTSSIYLNDSRRIVYPDEGSTHLFILKNNSIDTKAGGMGIVSYNNVDARFISNRFTGAGVAGIYVDGNAATSQFGENIQILGNKFAGSGYDMANVVLTENTRNCMVVGSDLKDNVIDDGYNNKVINITKKPSPHHNSGIHSHLKSMHDNMMRLRPSRPL